MNDFLEADFLEQLLKSGGSAYPSKWTKKDGATLAHMGMTLRDHFAGLAMQAMVVNIGRAIVASGGGATDLASFMMVATDADYVAEEAYKVADAMLAARGAK